MSEGTPKQLRLPSISLTVAPLGELFDTPAPVAASSGFLAPGFPGVCIEVEVAGPPGGAPGLVVIKLSPDQAQQLSDAILESVARTRKLEHAPCGECSACKRKAALS